MHYFKRNIGDYHTKAGRLTMLQHGAYTLLIDSCYDRERFPTIDDAIDWCWASSDDEVKAVEFVVKKFFDLVDGVYVQARIQEEIDKYHDSAKTNKRIALEREEKRRTTKRDKEATKREDKSTKRARSVNEACTVEHEAPPNQEPLTKNQEPTTKDQNTYVEGQRDAFNLNGSADENKIQDCPHKEIIAAFHECLPRLPTVMESRWAGSSRAKTLISRWKEDENHRRDDFWVRYFTAINKIDFYFENDRNWRPTLEWLITRKNFDSTIDRLRNL